MTTRQPVTAPQPVKLGSFIIDPSITYSELYDDNIFATRNDKERDFVSIVSPSLRLESDWTKHSLDFYTGADIARYAKHPSQDYEDYWAGTDGRYDISGNANFFGGAQYTHTHEPRSSPDAVNGTEPTTYDEGYGYGGFAGQFGRTSLRLGGTYTILDFSDVSSSTGTINEDDRDRSQYEIGTRIGYIVAPGYEAFLQTSGDIRRYQRTPDNNGFDRNSTGFGIAAGVRINVNRSALLEVLAGYLYQNYEDSSLKDVSTPDIGASLTWRVSSLTRVTAEVNRQINETTLAGASSYISTTVGASLDHTLLPDLHLNLDAYFTDDHYVGSSRDDHLLDLGGGVAYYLTPNIWIGTDYAFLQRNSNAAGEDYDDNQIFLRIGAQLQDEYTDSELAAAAAAGAGPDLSGFYAGVQAGYGELYTGLDGPRGAGGSLIADFGDHGPTEGGFAGYGLDFGDWYLGLELEGETSQASWDHAHTPNKRVFSVDKDETVGGAARLGYWTEGGSLLYGRFGVVGTTFDTRYQTDSGLVTDRTQMEPGVRFGGGIEVPASDNIFLRMDYTYTAYNDYSMPGGNGHDNFSNAESLVRFGLGYRFGGGESKRTQASVDYDFSGFYSGAQFGYGGLASENSGPREAGTTLEADRAAFGGTGGLFGGYGRRIDDFYLGLELDGGYSYANWNQQRDPTGRAISVSKEESFGASAILGYVLMDRALLYGRIGPAWAEFDTKYETSSNQVHQHDMQTGLRVGGGIEVPIAGNVFARMDYTYTDYESYKVSYGSGTDSFDNSESLFQIGIGYRF